MADHLRNALRPGDVVGRMGGDEFVAICRGIDNQEGALAITQRIAASMTWVFDAGTLTFPVSASVGATLVDPNTGIALALARADHAMYAAKRSRSEAGVLWDESLPPVADRPHGRRPRPLGHRGVAGQLSRHRHVPCGGRPPVPASAVDRDVQLLGDGTASRRWP